MGSSNPDDVLVDAIKQKVAEFVADNLARVLMDIRDGAGVSEDQASDEALQQMADHAADDLADVAAGVAGVAAQRLQGPLRPRTHGDPPADAPDDDWTTSDRTVTRTAAYAEPTDGRQDVAADRKPGGDPA